MMRLARLFLVLAGLLPSLAGVAQAHEVRPALLEITQTGETSYEVMFKQPQAQGRWLNIQVRFPATCQPASEPVPMITPSAIIETWRMDCPAGLAGETLAFPGLERTLTDVFVRVSLNDADQMSGLVKPDNPVFQVSANNTVGSYVTLGIWHILLGLDHVLFVILLTLLVEGTGRLLKAVTAFTLAHSLTLGAAALGLFTLPQAPVEVVVALSIAFLAHEVVEKLRGVPTLTAASPWIAAFGFGLLHGFGFAGALAELGLPHGARLQALFLFNVGVEIGQLIVIALTLPVIWFVSRMGERPGQTFARVAAYGCGSLAVLWVIERTGVI